MSRPGLLLASAVLCLPFSACVTSRHAAAPPPPPPQNYFAPATAGVPMRRVALLPLWNEKLPGEYLRDVDAAFSAELTKKAIFEVVPVTRSQMESICGERQLSSVEALPAEVLARLRTHFGVEGVIFTDLTSFSPYRPLSMGVRAKLIDVTTGQIRWAFDYIYDTGNDSVATAAKKFQLRYSNEHQPLTSDGGSILLSPSRFAKYVASETYGSLQAQPAPGIFSAKASVSPVR
jgi:hypothetical protein